MNSFTAKPPLGTPIDAVRAKAELMLGWWPVAEGAGPMCRDVMTGKIAIVTFPKNWTKGAYGPAYYCNAGPDTAQIVVASDHPAASIGAPISISVWCHSTTFSTGTGGLVAKLPTNGSWALFFEAGTLIWRGGSGVNRVSYAFPATMNSTWYHIVVTDDGITAIIYLNGVAVAIGTAGSPPVVTVNSINIGSLSTGVYVFSGLISDVRIRGKVMTPNEVANETANPFALYRRRPTPFVAIASAPVAGFPPALIRGTSRFPFQAFD